MASVELSEVPMTLLDAVNVLLRSVGLVQTTNLLNTNQDGQDALDALNRANVNIQSLGWHCNSETITLSPGTNGTIQIPETWTEVRAQRGTQTYALQDLVVRQGQLYDKKKSSFVFTGPVQLEFIQVLDFEDLPAALRWYVTCDAGKSFGVGTYPSSGTFRFTEEARVDAKAWAEQSDDNMRDTNLAGTSPHVAQMRRGRH